VKDEGYGEEINGDLGEEDDDFRRV